MFPNTEAGANRLRFFFAQNAGWDEAVKTCRQSANAYVEWKVHIHVLQPSHRLFLWDGVGRQLEV